MKWKKFDVKKLKDGKQYLFHRMFPDRSNTSDDYELVRYDVMSFYKVIDHYEFHGEFKILNISKNEKFPFDYFIEIPEETHSKNLISPEKELPEDNELVVGIIQPTEYYDQGQNIQVFRFNQDNLTFSNPMIYYSHFQISYWFRFPLLNFRYFMNQALKEIC